MLRSILGLTAAFSLALGAAARSGRALSAGSGDHAGRAQPGSDAGKHRLDDLPARPDAPYKAKEAYTERVKREQLYKGSPCFASGTRLRAFEEDHRVPLGLGGAAYDRVCRGRLTLAQGQAAFLGDWTHAYRRYLGERLPRGAPKAILCATERMMAYPISTRANSPEERRSRTATA